MNNNAENKVLLAPAGYDDTDITFEETYFFYIAKYNEKEIFITLKGSELSELGFSERDIAENESKMLETTYEKLKKFYSFESDSLIHVKDLSLNEQRVARFLFSEIFSSQYTNTCIDKETYQDESIFYEDITNLCKRFNLYEGCIDNYYDGCFEIYVEYLSKFDNNEWSMIPS